MAEKILNLTEKNQKYFHSKSLFLHATKSTKAIFAEIIVSLKRNHQTILKDLLAISEFHFLYNTEKKQNENPLALDFYTKEEIADSISFLIFQVSKLKIINSDSVNKLNEKKILNDGYSKLIINACLLKKYIEWEVFIDSFGYQCVQENKEIHIIHSEPFLGKSIQHGWIYTQIQKLNLSFNTLSNFRKKALSLEDFCDNIYEKLGDKILKRKQVPLERLVLEFPEYPPIIDFLTSDAFFLEELAILTEECKEMFINIENLLNFEIVKQLTFKDIMVVHRLFNFLRIIFSKYLDDHLEDDPEIVFRSLLPVFNNERLTELFGRLIGKEKASIFIELFAWEKGSEKLFDLQYRPILKINEYCILPINIMCKSNVFRNTLFIARKRLYDKTGFDPIANLLKEDLEKYCFKVKTDVVFKHKGIVGDIDLISQVGNTTFIVEAKNTLLPGNTFELRTIYDHLIKAGLQLTKIKQAIMEPTFAKYISQKVGWEINADNVCTCIVLGNRLFSGYKLQNHPVRSVFELSHFITEGDVRYQDDNTYSLWQGTEFGEEDLINYLVKDVFHEFCYEIMEEALIKFQLNETKFNIHTYSANYDSFSEKLQSRFPYSTTT